MEGEEEKKERLTAPEWAARPGVKAQTKLGLLPSFDRGHPC